MAIELRQQLKLTQQLIMTPQLQMAIKLLQLSRLELVDTIRQELEENPTLEEVQETADRTKEGEPEEAPAAVVEDAREVTIEEKINDEIDWSNYIDEYNAPGKVNFESENRETPQYEAFVSSKESLSDHLLWQLLMLSPTDIEKQVGSLIIGNLNRDGYLQLSVEELSQQSGISIEMVEDVLETMQSFDPVGICARDLRECLLLQARLLNLEDSLVTDIISDHLKNLENKNFKAICKALKVKMKDVVAAVNVIRALEPKPGRQFNEETPHYIIPDIYVYKSEGDFVIVLNDDGMPKLRVNPFYKRAITHKNEVSTNAKDYIRDKMRSAAWLIRSIHQRQKTIYKVMESILKFQRDFFEKGVIHLKPMVLRDVAEDIGMHESTISRVTTNKYAHTPQGIYELKYFFNSSIRRVHGEDIASASVQAKIKKLIEGENPKKPYSDSKMAEMLKADNIDIARRTVAKYREMMGILSSSKRKQF
ncbi:RNA polymerase sigma-54 factor [Desulfosarcina ovata subsp. sediminis]|uniref:RNA polymerase sigma-54 factor n=1 Tax=Desulfosarcina ovata subsp. sediminis TaxID=885957 RepID=A0A5K7ZM57_9BACT|nr:RNA polymerase factor sigma-54 [Desulfosarcina ovata]BBO79530.1 RNA polymerase sigma-54 factor [Desulfosarcina ovata subsp. sediminis]